MNQEASQLPSDNETPFCLVSETLSNIKPKKALKKLRRKEMLKLYQTELIKMQEHLEKQGMQMIVIFEGRDTAGKGGAIKRVLEYVNPKHNTTIALSKPDEKVLSQLFIQRYVSHLPSAGEVLLFDRSWYNRAMVEPVLGFCTKKEYKEFLEDIPCFERMLTRSDKTIFIKLYFSISKKVQAERLEARERKPHKQWKLSEADKQAQEYWDDFTKAKFKMLRDTHTPHAPWTVIRSNNKHKSRLSVMKVLLNSVDYEGKNSNLDIDLDPEIVIDGADELEFMRNQRTDLGKFYE